MLEYLSFMWKVRVGWIFQTFQASTQTKQEIRLPEFWAESVGPKHRIILSSADFFVQKRFAWRVLCYVLVYFARSWTLWTLNLRGSSHPKYLQAVLSPNQTYWPYCRPGRGIPKTRTWTAHWTGSDEPKGVPLGTRSLWLKVSRRGWALWWESHCQV